MLINGVHHDRNPRPPAAHVRRDLSIDQQLALRTAATRLQKRFTAMFGVETIERMCTHNAGRSQMALGFFTHLAIQAMFEVGIDISDEFTKPWTDEIVRAADVVITMGCGDACPIFPGRRYEEWVVDDPAGKDLAEVRLIRDNIEEHRRRLLTDLHVSTD